MYVNEIPLPELSLQDSDSQLSQPLLLGEMLQSYHLHGPCRTLSPVCPCLSYTDQPRTEGRPLGTASVVLRGTEGLPSLTR